MKVEPQIYQVRVLHCEGEWSDWWPITKSVYDHYKANLGAKAQVRVLVDEADMRKVIDALLLHCDDPECLKCGAIICPHGEPLHFHHDGCPSCSQDPDQ
ncbi:hypothetical protein Psp6_00030 [Pseudomonas phage Psp6]|nr:hypothetical protein Psp6_00030 [Pseudomonas phage Psp6]